MKETFFTIMITSLCFAVTTIAIDAVNKKWQNEAIQMGKAEWVVVGNTNAAYLKPKLEFRWKE